MRLSVTDRCNLRCRYCMPQEGIQLKDHSEMLSEDEMVMAAETAALLGINKIRITGGEPLVKKNIISICERIGKTEGITDLALTTNGVYLDQYAKDLLRAGVKRLNISLDTLNEEKYRYISRSGSLSDALKGIETALNAGFEKIKINTVLIGGFNDDEIRSLAEMTMDRPVDVRFIELMPMPGACFSEESFIPVSKVREIFPEAEELSFETTAKMLRLPNAKGRIGLISPVSNHFCGVCNRIRLTADGKLKPCLHSSDEYIIKGLSKEEMKEQFIKAITNKPQCHAKLSFDSPSGSGRAMNTIGG